MRFTKFTLGSCALLVAFGSNLTPNTIQGQAPVGDPPPVRPPVELPPTPIGATPPTTPVVPASANRPQSTLPARKPAPFDRFRKYDELPELTRQLVFTTVRGIEWMTRDEVHLPSGRFLPGLNPALNKPSEEDHFLRQATAAVAMARAAKLTGDDRHAVHAYQTILALLSELPKDPSQPGARRPAFLPIVCNPTAAAAFVMMAIHEMPDPPATLLEAGEELATFLKGQVKTDGSIAFAEENTAELVNQLAGPTMYALALSQRTKPAKWKQDALGKGFAYYRKFFQTNPHPQLVPWLTAAYADYHLQTKEAVFAEFVFEMNDWLQKLQYDGSERKNAAWRGGFPSVADGKLVFTPPTIETALAAQSFAAACKMLRNMEHPDTDRYNRYKTSLHRALQFVSTLQYTEEATQHFASPYRPMVVGAFSTTPTDGNIRTDQTALAVAAFAQFLLSGADQ